MHRMTRAALLAFALAACGGAKSAPPAAAEPAAQPASAPAQTPPAPEDPSCPAFSEYGTVIDTACPTPGVACGGARCRDAKGFCNIIACRDGVWRNVEVPPPPP